MGTVAWVGGIGVLLVTLADIFLTVLYARSSRGVLSMELNRVVWRLFRGLAHLLPRIRASILSFAGPTLVALVVLVWVSLLTLGFALIAWPALGTGIQAGQGSTSTGFATAIYYSGYAVTTLGTGDIVATSPLYRLLMIVEAVLGFSTFTAAITYFLSVYNAITSRNAFALELYLSTRRSGDAVELIVLLGPAGQFEGAKQTLTEMGRELLRLLESHHSYPVLHYFRFRQPYYALGRITLVSMDTATLIKTALNEERYRTLVDSGAVEQLWGAGLHLLDNLSRTFRPGTRSRDTPNLAETREDVWRERYHAAIERFRAAGIETTQDTDVGAERYVALRRDWNSHVAAFADYMMYPWQEIAPTTAGQGETIRT